MNNNSSVTDQNLLRIRLRAIARSGMLFSGSKFARCLVNEYPKSGGSWLAKMLAGGLAVDFPQNVLPTKFPAIFHGHYMRDYHKVPKVILWREPRDIMVSWYYHCLFGNERNNLSRVEKNRKSLGFIDVENVAENMPVFIDWCFSPVGEPNVTWNEFYDKWGTVDDVNVFHTSYEKLRTNPVDEVGRILEWFGVYLSASELDCLVKDHSFGNQVSRKAGVQDSGSFLRKGIVGDWENVFTEDARKKIEFYIGPREHNLKHLLYRC